MDGRAAVSDIGAAVFYFCNRKYILSAPYRDYTVLPDKTIYVVTTQNRDLWHVAVGILKNKKAVSVILSNSYWGITVEMPAWTNCPMTANEFMIILTINKVICKAWNKQAVLDYVRLLHMI